MPVIKSVISDTVNKDFSKAIKTIKEIGYNYVDLHTIFNKLVEDLTDSEIIEAKRILQLNGVKVASLASTVFMMSKLYEYYQITNIPSYLTASGELDKQFIYLQRLCEIAKEFDCKVIRAFPFRYPSNKKVLEDKRDLLKMKNIFYKAAKICETKGITLVVENCPYSHLPKGQMTFELVNEVGLDNFGLLWDPANSYRAVKKQIAPRYHKLNIYDEYDLIFKSVLQIHLKNYAYDNTYYKKYRHTSLFEGDIDFTKLLNTIKQRHKDVIISLEPEVDYDLTITSLKAFLNYSNKIKL